MLHGILTVTYFVAVVVVGVAVVAAAVVVAIGVGGGHSFLTGKREECRWPDAQGPREAELGGVRQPFGEAASSAVQASLSPFFVFIVVAPVAVVATLAIASPSFAHQCSCCCCISSAALR